MKTFLLILLLAVAVVAGGAEARYKTLPVSADPVAATYVSAHDGDTFVFAMADGKLVKVRLYEVDAPEIGQDGGETARDAARMMLARAQQIELVVVGRSYDRDVAVVTLVVDGARVDLGCYLTEHGLAWFCRAGKHSVRQDILRSNQEAAVAYRVGLWSGATPPVEPKFWRDHRDLIIYDDGTNLLQDIQVMNQDKQIELKVE